MTLLKLTGIEQQIRATYLNRWLEVTPYDPENRYATLGMATLPSAEALIGAADRLLAAL